MRILQGYKVREIAGENVIIMSGSNDTDMTRLVTLNQSALMLWNSLVNCDFAESDVESLLLESYEVEPEIAQSDAHKWVDQMCRLGIVE